uniref:Uncharacterized protein n=1 Tax=Xenopus tropicalis TaxID=8364 RepID=A0A803K650_XENTR
IGWCGLCVLGLLGWVELDGLWTFFNPIKKSILRCPNKCPILQNIYYFECFIKHPLCDCRIMAA